MAKKTAKLTIEVEFDDEVTDAEGMTLAVDYLLNTALSTEGILDDYGNPQIGQAYVGNEG
jgi:hypothetical protein